MSLPITWEDVLAARTRIAPYLTPTPLRHYPELDAATGARILVKHEIWATGTTGTLIEKALGVSVFKLQSGPLGGDQQIGAMIVEGKIDFLMFFWDPLAAQPHDPDVKALLRMAVVWNVPVACDRATADFIISSPLMHGEYERLVPDYEAYAKRSLAVEVKPAKKGKE